MQRRLPPQNPVINLEEERARTHAWLTAANITDRADLIFAPLRHGNELAPQSPWLNLGFWRDASNFEEAASALAMLLAHAARFEDSLDILDLGCGLGAQDGLWIDKFPNSRILACDSSAPLIEAASLRTRDARIRFECRSATSPWQRAAFDRVVALEAAMHFPTRRDFLEAAHGALRECGICAFTDLLVRMPRGEEEIEAYYNAFALTFQVPRENLVTSSDLEQTLREIGYTSINISSIREDVIPPFLEFARRQAQDQSLPLATSTRAAWSTPYDPLFGFDYVLATAVRSAA